MTIRPWDESTEYPTKYHPSGIGSLGLYIVTPLKGYILVSRVTSCVATHLYTQCYSVQTRARER